MREILFRAWDIQSKSMIYPLEISFDTTSNLWHVWYGFEADEKVKCRPSEIMQFTGLKDFKGKEIYEGDIVHVIYDDTCDFMGEDQDYKDVVYFDSETAGFMIKRPIGADTLEAGQKTIEVVGNRFETPELLEK